MKDSENPPLDRSKWDFREFAAFLQCADPTFVAQRAGSDDAIDELARSRSGPATPVHAVDGLCPTSPVTPDDPQVR